MVARSPAETGGGSAVGVVLCSAGSLANGAAARVADEVAAELVGDVAEPIFGEACVVVGGDGTERDVAGAGGPLSIIRLMISPAVSVIAEATAATETIP